MKKIISASRRTELVAHHPDYMVEQLLRVGLQHIHTVVVWTKDPTNLLMHKELRETLSHVGQVFVHWTVSGLGGTFVEPNVPSAVAQLTLLDDIVTFVGDPRRIHWRYDPLVSARNGDGYISNVDLDVFRSLAEIFGGAGVPVVHASFATMYRKVERRLSAAGIQLEHYGPEASSEFISALADAAEEVSMRLNTCSQPGFPIQRCIDGELLAQIHPTNESCRADRARGQRALCGCTVSLDIGHYLPCPNRCLYCYAHPASRD